MSFSAKYLLALCLLLSTVGSNAIAKPDAPAEASSARAGTKANPVADPQQRRAALRAALTLQPDPKGQGQDVQKPHRQLSREERTALRRELQQQRAEVLTKPAVSSKP